MPMRNAYSGETYISMKESHTLRAFEEYDTPLTKHSHGPLHIISDELVPDTSDDIKHPLIIRI